VTGPGQKQEAPHHRLTTRHYHHHHHHQRHHQHHQHHHQRHQHHHHHQCLHYNLNTTEGLSYLRTLFGALPASLHYLCSTVTTSDPVAQTVQPAGNIKVKPLAAPVGVRHSDTLTFRVHRDTGTSQLNFHTESSTTTPTTTTINTPTTTTINTTTNCLFQTSPAQLKLPAKNSSLFLVIFNLKSLTKRLKEGSRRYRGAAQQRISTATVHSPLPESTRRT